MNIAQDAALAVPRQQPAAAAATMRHPSPSVMAQKSASQELGPCRCKVRLPTEPFYREFQSHRSLDALRVSAARKLGVQPEGALVFTADGKPLSSDRDVLLLRHHSELVLTTPMWSPHALAGSAAAELLSR